MPYEPYYQVYSQIETSLELYSGSVNLEDMRKEKGDEYYDGYHQALLDCGRHVAMMRDSQPYFKEFLKNERQGESLIGKDLSHFEVIFQ